MRKSHYLSKTVNCLLYIIAGIIFAVSFLAVLLGDGDKGFLDL
jgi:hypothetical protein